MNRNKEMETIYDSKWGTDWQNNVIAGVQYAKSRQEILDTLAEFQRMWKGRLSRIDMAKHCISLTAPYVRTISSAHYCTGPKLCIREA